MRRAALPSVWGASRSSIWRSPAVAAVCLAGVFFLDLVMWATQPSYFVRGVLDEPAHLATAFLALTAISSLAPAATAVGTRLAALAASILIDVDHTPEALFAAPFLTAGTPRPYTHSLATILVLLTLALAARRSRRRGLLAGACAGAALGVALHLTRDLATGEVALWWPVPGNVHVPYWAYAALLVLFAIVTAVAGPLTPHSPPSARVDVSRSD